MLSMLVSLKGLCRWEGVNLDEKSALRRRSKSRNINTEVRNNCCWGPTVARDCVDTGACYRKTHASLFVFFSFQLSRITWAYCDRICRVVDYSLSRLTARSIWTPGTFFLHFRREYIIFESIPAGLGP